MAMKTSRGASALSFLLLVFGNGRAAGQAKSSNDMAERVSKPVVYQVEGMDRVRVRKDLVYKKDGAVELKMDVSTPEKQKPGESLPVVIFIHGGVPRDVPVKPKDWGIYRSWARLIAASEMAAVTFNHRVGYPDPNLSQGAADLMDAIAFVRARAKEFGIDPERIALAAYSAGGPLLAAPIREPKPYIRCLVAFYSILDLRPSALHRKFLSEEQVRQRSDSGPAAGPGSVRRGGACAQRSPGALQPARRGARLRQPGRRPALTRYRPRSRGVSEKQPRGALVSNTSGHRARNGIGLAHFLRERQVCLVVPPSSGQARVS
jgi:acetyl esterase/lipase